MRYGSERVVPVVQRSRTRPVALFAACAVCLAVALVFAAIYVLSPPPQVAPPLRMEATAPVEMALQNA